MENREHGTIKNFLPDKKFGFIEADGGNGVESDLFFHIASSNLAVSGAIQGLRVTFEREPSPKQPGKYRAANVKREGID